jgi:ElaB/YqjD/DUF883 family membrane-anchored ribosome-binding protein
MSDMTPKTAKLGGSKPVDAGDEIESQLHTIRAEVAAMAEMMGTFVKEKVHAFGATAEAAADEASARARKARDSMEQRVGQAEKALDHQVQAHPLQSILLAFGLGILVSMLIRR